MTVENISKKTSGSESEYFISQLHAEEGREVPANEDPMLALYEAKFK